MSYFSVKSALIIAAHMLTCSVIAQFVFVSQRSSLKNELFYELMGEIESHFRPDEIASNVHQSVFRAIMTEIRVLHLSNSKSSEKAETSTILSDITTKEKKKKTELPQSDFSSFQSTEFSQTRFQPKLSHAKSILSRALNVDPTFCNGTLFRLDLALDSYPNETSWELVNEQTNTTIAQQSYGKEDEDAFFSHEECLELSSYSFSLFDSFADGIDCNNTVSCYNVSLDNEIVDIGVPFDDEITYGYNLSSLCPPDSLYSVFLQVQFDYDTNPYILWELRDDISDETYFLEPTLNLNDEFTNTYHTCLIPGIYSFEMLTTDRNATNCAEFAEFDDCYRILVDHEIVIRGSDFPDDGEVAHSISISIAGNAIERKCHLHPLLSPMNYFNDFNYKQTLGNNMQIFLAISSMDTLKNFYTPQYKAACWILFDDVMQLSFDDKSLVERYILAVLLYSTNQSPEILLPSNICNFRGIICNTQGYIVDIDLSARGLSGTIPTEITHLRLLESINLKENQLVGTIPPELQLLNKLRRLVLLDNALTGTIPTEIGVLSNLRKFDLSVNFFEGNIPSEIGLFSKLHSLMIFDNMLTGSIPSEIFNSPDLDTVWLDHNHLTGTIPNNVDLPRQYSRLVLNNNFLTGTIPSHLGTLLYMHHINLSGNRLTGTIPSNFKGLFSVETFYLHNNMLTGTIPDIFENKTDLEALLFSNNKLTGPIPDSIWNINMTTLEELGLEHNFLTGTVPRTFCSFDGSLKIDNLPWFDDLEVECSCCGWKADCFVWNTDIELGEDTTRPPCPDHNVHTFDFINDLDITDETTNVVFNDFANTISIFESSVCLSPTGCYDIEYGVDSVDLIAIRDSNKLNYNNEALSLAEQKRCDDVQICGVSINSSDPKRIILNQITQLGVDNMNLLNDQESPTYKALCWIMTEDVLIDTYDVCDGTLLQRYVMALFFYSQENTFSFDTFALKDTCEWPGITCDPDNKYIQRMNLPDRGLDRYIITQIGLLQRLETIDLRSNRLTGSLPKEIGYLMHLKSLDLADNQLHGTMDPFIFTHLPNLATIDLSDNRLTGNLPVKIFQPQQLQNISLANNLFGGPLFNDFTCSLNLEHLNISNNLLQGRIAETVFSCENLKSIDVSKNVFTGLISPSIGDMENLEIAYLNGNRLTGSIPVSLFNSKNIRELMIQSNKLTGSIPTQVGNLVNATAIAMSHNSLKGEIPKELQNLENLELLHLHSNSLTGKAPEIQFRNATKNTYIADCGSPSYLLTKIVDCKTCTMCCNSEDECQERDVFNLNVWLETGLVAVGAPFAVILAGFLFLKVRKTFKFHTFFADRDLETVYCSESVYCFILSRAKLAWFFYLVIAVLQMWLYCIYLDASNVTNEKTDFRFNFRCIGNSIECADGSSVGQAGWAIFFMVTILFLARDFTMSLLQILNALILRDIQLLLSGIGILILTVMSMYTSFRYNFALGEKNTDLVTNAVIILFINDMDEQFLSLLQILAPKWTSNLLEDIEENVKSKATSNVLEEIEENVKSKATSNVLEEECAKSQNHVEKLDA